MGERVGEQLLLTTECGDEVLVLGVEEIAGSPLEFVLPPPHHNRSFTDPLSIASFSSSNSSWKDGGHSPEPRRPDASQEEAATAAVPGPGTTLVGRPGTTGSALASSVRTGQGGRLSTAGIARARAQSSSRSSHSSSSSDSRRNSQDDSIDGLVLMNSTRLRPAAKTAPSGETFLKLYLQTYRSLFGRKDSTTAILPLALYGNLRNSPFRSLCWRVLLNVLPSSSLDWVASLDSTRSNFNHFKEEYLCKDRIHDRSLDLSVNNPLSQAADSPWNQHFQDGELRRIIEQDVVRISPEMDFFHSEEVRESMINILFVYAKTHPEISYKQGMHELLAHLYFVLHVDIQSYLSAVRSAAESSENLRELQRSVPAPVFQSDFLEHDAYALLEALMDCMGDWYKYSDDKESRLNSSVERPWSRTQDVKGNKLGEKLTHIQESLLKRHDPALYLRLEKLEIYPQLYGIRWLRVLFSREFSFVDTLVIWDAIFADSCPPGLADQITVSLLMSVRDLLLVYDYTDAVSLLMKLPSNISVNFIVSFALHLKDPLRFAKPAGSVFDHGPGAVPRQQKPQGLQQRSSRPRASQPSASRARREPVKKELIAFEKTFAIQNPRDLPEFTVVDLADLDIGASSCAGGAGDEEAKDVAIIGGEGDVAPAPNITTREYCNKLQALKQLDTLRDLLKKETLISKAKIFKTLDDLQVTCEGIFLAEQADSSPRLAATSWCQPTSPARLPFSPAKAPFEERPFHEERPGKESDQPVSSFLGKIKRNPSVALDVSAYFKEN